MTARERGLLALGDALALCALGAPGARFDLVYLDPPYGVGAEMAARTRAGERRGRRGRDSGPTAYRDDASLERLLEMLGATLAALRDRLSERGNLWLHLDHRAVHDAKVLADRVFGRGAFLGEVVWSPGNGARGARGFSVTHQTILRYARDAQSRRRVAWNADDPALREPFAETSLAMHFQHVDAEGRRYRERTISGRTYRYYADVGRRLGSVWTDLPSMRANTPLRPEATGYPTQKPVALLDRIVRAASLPGDLVCDPMCGSGTTLVAAARLGRRFVGGDRSELAFEAARRRLEAEGIAFDALRLPEGGGVPAAPRPAGGAPV